MVVLADEILESFFETDLSSSFRLERAPDAEVPLGSAGLLGDLWSTIATDSNKKIFNTFTDEIGKTIGKHQVSAFFHVVTYGVFPGGRHLNKCCLESSRSLPFPHGRYGLLL